MGRSSRRGAKSYFTHLAQKCAKHTEHTKYTGIARGISSISFPTFQTSLEFIRYRNATGNSIIFTNPNLIFSGGNNNNKKERSAVFGGRWNSADMVEGGGEGGWVPTFENAKMGDEPEAE